MQNVNRIYVVVVIVFILSGCAGNLLMDYSAYPFDPRSDESMLVDLSQRDDHAKVYFESRGEGSKRKMLLLTSVNNVSLINNRQGIRSRIRPLGYQVLVIDPGAHDLGVCYIEKNAFGGANNCVLGVRGAQLDAGGHYMMRFRRSGDIVEVFMEELKMGDAVAEE